MTEDKLKIQTIHKLNTTQKSKQRKTQQNKTSLVQSPFMTLGQETRWAYTTMLPSPHGARVKPQWKTLMAYFLSVMMKHCSDYTNLEA